MKKFLFYFGIFLYVYAELYVLLVDPVSIYYDPFEIEFNRTDNMNVPKYKKPVMDSKYQFCHSYGRSSHPIFIEKNRRWAGYLFIPVDCPYVFLQRCFAMRDPHIYCEEDKDSINYHVWRGRCQCLQNIVRGIAWFLPWLWFVFLERKDWRRLGVSTLLYIGYLVFWGILCTAWTECLDQLPDSSFWIQTFILALYFALLAILAYDWYKRSRKSIFLIIPVVIACSIGLFHLVTINLLCMVKNWL